MFFCGTNREILLRNQTPGCPFLMDYSNNLKYNPRYRFITFVLSPLREEALVIRFIANISLEMRGHKQERKAASC